MNQHRYRLVYNRARRMLMAVAETAVSLGTTPGSRDVPASPPAHRFQLRGLALALWLA
ncbi:MAG: ESPR domain-containing protein [Gammaproteobacteria bacterium]|nr:ESPR domain-containing protein [Gammaproteobacteria bacterium]